MLTFTEGNFLMECLDLSNCTHACKQMSNAGRLPFSKKLSEKGVTQLQWITEIVFLLRVLEFLLTKVLWMKILKRIWVTFRNIFEYT